MRRYHKLVIWRGHQGMYQEATVSGKEDLVRVFDAHTRQIRKVSRREFAAILQKARAERHTTIERYPDRGW